jgi:hypothetical protein
MRLITHEDNTKEEGVKEVSPGPLSGWDIKSLDEEEPLRSAG